MKKQCVLVSSYDAAVIRNALDAKLLETQEILHILTNAEERDLTDGEWGCIPAILAQVAHGEASRLPIFIDEFRERVECYERLLKEFAF